MKRLATLMLVLFLTATGTAAFAGPPTIGALSRQDGDCDGGSCPLPPDGGDGDDNDGGCGDCGGCGGHTGDGDCDGGSCPLPPDGGDGDDDGHDGGCGGGCGGCGH